MSEQSPNTPLPLTAVVLAAGLGSRMFSQKPKVMQTFAGKMMIEHVLGAIESSPAERTIVVYGHQGDLLQAALADKPLEWALQKDLLGTGHAVMQVLDRLSPGERVIICAGDVPLITPETLAKLHQQTPANAVGLVTAKVKSPFGLGRIVRDAAGKVTSIIEETDATDQQKAINEINTGIMLVPAEYLQNWLTKLSTQNAQQEYYLTDIIAIAREQSIPIETVSVTNEIEVSGVNTMEQLVLLERKHYRRLADDLLRQGLRIHDPDRLDIRGDCRAGKDSEIDVNVILEGSVVIGDRVSIGANCSLKNVILEDDVIIKPHTVVEDATIKSGATVGPFARIRPETIIGPHVRIGNFVEVKKSHIDYGSKISHLSYIGDATIGKNANIGAGAITVNYDGANKYETIIEDDVFVGCDSQLIAPLCLRSGAFIAAGTTVTKDVPSGTLTLSRAPQKTIDGWTRPTKKKER